MTLLIGTHNPGKLKEYRRLLPALNIPIIGAGDIEIPLPDVEETGTTFEENAILKAKTYAELSQHITLADDSGLCVDALDGRPGLYSARYGTSDLDDAGRRAYLLDEMRDVPDEKRTAYFICVIAVYDPTREKVLTVEGRCTGQILREDRTEGYGFGYDPVFIPDGYDKTFGQMQPEMKNGLSHRAIAAEKLAALLNDWLA
ncbi:MAG: RdgB/HAM1 family non-canonical purine NTP pyrophosphatase [Aggregatilineales bacterium]